MKRLLLLFLCMAGLAVAAEDYQNSPWKVEHWLAKDEIGDAARGDFDLCNLFYRETADSLYCKTTLLSDWQGDGKVQWSVRDAKGFLARLTSGEAGSAAVRETAYRGVLEWAIARPAEWSGAAAIDVIVSENGMIADQIEWSRDSHRPLDGDVGNCAFVHHGNQGLTYTDVFRGQDGTEGFDEILELHQGRSAPGNFHLSGTLMTAADWYDPAFLTWMQDGIAEGWLGVLGSAYAQHIMPFVYDNMNNWAVGIEQDMIDYKFSYSSRVAWIPERVWCAQGHYPDAGLNDPWLGDNWTQHGIDAVILDDWPHVSGYSDRKIHWMNNGSGITLRVIPIDGDFTGNCHYNPSAAIAQIQSTGRYGIIVYGTDWEAAAEMADFNCPDCLENYSQVVNWAADNFPAVDMWKLDAALDNPDFNGTGIEVGNGTYGLIGGNNGYGGTNNSWYTHWAGYASLSDYHAPAWNYGQIWTTVYGDVTSAPANNLSETAWYVMMTNLHETAWHDYMGGPISGWQHRYSAHIKNAAVYAEAAHWAAGEYANTCGAFFSDIDLDGVDELVIHNDRVLAVFESIGGRAQYIFSKGPTSENFSIVGSCNTYWAETDGDYDEPGSNNHQAAFADVSPTYRNDLYALSIDSNTNSFAKIRMSFGTVEKTIEVAAGAPYLQARYDVGAQNCYIRHGFSPDLLGMIWDADMERIWDPDQAYSGYRNPNSGATGALVKNNGGTQHITEFSGTLLRGDELRGHGEFTYLLYAGPTSAPDGNGRVAELDALTALNLDTYGPRMNAQAAFINSNTIEVTFSEAVNEALAEVPANWMLSGFVPAHTVTAAVRQGDWTKVRLTVTPNLGGGENGIVSVVNVTDMNGNVVDPNFDEAALAVPNGLTPHTIVIDGTQDFDVANECLIAGTDTLTITWDANALYIGYWRKDLATGDLFVDIDTDQLTNSGAATDSWGRVQFANPHRIEYQVAIEGGPSNMQINHWTGAAWTYLQYGQHGGESYNGWSGNPFTEMRIPWSDLGNPTGIALAVHVTQEESQITTRALPPANPTGTLVTLSHFYLIYPPYASGPLPLMGARTKDILSADIVAPELVISGQSGTPHLYWDAVTGAHTYEIHRATSSDGPYTYLTETTSTEYEDSSVLPGDRVFYTIVARGGI
ncbi:MAG: hypothetical protein H6508_08495 [Calditrichaeota bacterium]|nr:hypothetical protein [Calditrichota bacterium]MCB9367203.1 hypothetical protein [Calditrichota bacterium]